MLSNLSLPLQNEVPDKCPVCHQGKLRLVLSQTSGLDVTPTADYCVLACERCGTGQTLPRPSNEVLNSHYHSGVYSKSGGRGLWLIDRLLNSFHRQRLREISNYVDPPVRLLDVGSGKGRFVANAVRYGWQAQGVEPSAGQVYASQQRYGIEVFAGELAQANFPDTSFDVVTAWHVLEHIDDPQALVTEIYRILRPGGLFVCEVPNFVSWQARLGQERWFHLDIPRHLVHYSPSGLQNLLTRYGFQIIALETFSLESGPIGMIESLLNRLGMPMNWLYRWAKRLEKSSPLRVLQNLLMYMLVAGPAAVFEWYAAHQSNSGGVLRIIATTSER